MSYDTLTCRARLSPTSGLTVKARTALARSGQIRVRCRTCWVDAFVTPISEDGGQRFHVSAPTPQVTQMRCAGPEALYRAVRDKR